MIKGIFLSIFFSFLSVGLTQAQSTEDPFSLIDSLYWLVDSGEVEKSVEVSLKIEKLQPALLMDYLHNSLSQSLKDDDHAKPAKNYLEQLNRQNLETLNQQIKPLYLWSKAIDSDKSAQVKEIINSLSTLLASNTATDSYLERYTLLALNEPAAQKNISKNKRLKVLRQVISKLETKANLSHVNIGRKATQERAQARYLLAYVYFRLYSNFDHKEEYLKKASLYSPDGDDTEGRYACFYDAALLTGNTEQIGFKHEYYNYLKQHQRDQEALDLISKITVDDPGDENMALLKAQYAQMKSDTPFSTYWHQVILKKAQDVPPLKFEFPSGVLDLTHKTGHWVYLDVWGTWCVPCVSELPELQTFYLKSQQDHMNHLKVYTLSFNSNNLAAFMGENQYTFPVSEIDKSVVKAFNVQGFPTKILITPEGKYLKIRFGADWQTFIKNYCLL